MNEKVTVVLKLISRHQLLIIFEPQNRIWSTLSSAALYAPPIALPRPHQYKNKAKQTVFDRQAGQIDGVETLIA